MIMPAPDAQQRRGPSLLEQEIGTNLLDMIVNLWSLIPFRSEHVEIVDHQQARRAIRIQIDLHEFAGYETQHWPPWQPGPAVLIRPRLHQPLPRWRGRILVPLAVLTHESNEM